MDSLEVSVLDQEIVDALQISPRASWASVGRALGVSEVTVARRWRNLEEHRLAWTGIALHPGVSYGAVLEVRCAPREVDNLANGLAQHPDVSTVGQTTGSYNLFAIIIATTLEGVLDAVHGGLPELIAATEVRTNLFHQITGGVDWRQGILSAAEERQMQDERRRTPRDARRLLAAHDRELFLALSADARRPISSVARSLARRPDAVSRRLAELEAANQVTFRCDVSRPAFDLQLGALVLMKTPPLESENTARALGMKRETRFCASVVAEANVILVVGLHDLADAERLLARLAVDHPDGEIVDRRVLTRMFKIHGRLLDDQGRSVGHVPVDPWIRAPA